ILVLFDPLPNFQRFLPKLCLNYSQRVVVKKLTQHLTGLLFGDCVYISKKLIGTLEVLSLSHDLRKIWKANWFQLSCFLHRVWIKTAIG
ncbi:MAG: transposase, partial [Candidatus Midichloria sp.]|nr:transposase [Candidatus Midichloria sp.]